jgi:hypothetical protein
MHLFLVNETNKSLTDGDFFIDKDAGRVYFVNETYAGTNIAFSGASDTQKIRNFNLYTIENGVKTYATRDSLESASELVLWRTENAAAAVVDERPTEEEKEPNSMIYKKGQLVAYDIGYTD